MTIIWRSAFLIALPQTGTIAGAARLAKVSRPVVYDLMRADAGFDRQVRAIIAKYAADAAAKRERQVRYQLQAAS